MIEKTIGLFPADGLRRELPIFHLRFVGAVCGQCAGAFCVHLEDPAGCAERRAGLRAGGEHPTLRLDGSVIRSTVLPCLHCGADVLPPVGGKTTVSRLAARFWDYQKGSITVGGMEVSRIDPEKLMSLYSIVFQDVTLFDNTIMENIRIGRQGATDEEVMEAARLAHCDEFVERMPEKWNTMIGENGSELSGGERQRISIARAFLKDAPIILLDEATASLDVDNESFIQESISKLICDKTVLIIAHRMRTVDGVDKIVVLKDGTVAEQGSPAELKQTDGIYKHMVEMQMESAAWRFE